MARGAVIAGAVGAPAMISILSMLLIAAALPRDALAQSAPEELSPEAASTGDDSDGGPGKIVPVDPGWFHNWRATIDYAYREGPLVDVDLSRNGTSHSDQVLLGIEAGIGRRGFARIEGGFDFGNSDRALRFDDMEGSYDRRFIGGSGGIFLFRFLAVGAQARYGSGEEEDTLTNRSFGDVVESERDDEEWRVAPFALLTAPLGPVRLSLLGGYVHIERESDYSDPTLPDDDKAAMDLWVINGGADWHITRDLTVGATVGWTEITNQDTQFGAVPLDEEWGSVDGHARYQLFDGFEVTVRGGHDFDNSQGNGFRIGGGFAYRF
jgi:hypothetical protein